MRIVPGQQHETVPLPDTKGVQVAEQSFRLNGKALALPCLAMKTVELLDRRQIRMAADTDTGAHSLLDVAPRAAA
jgi:hypothetical protein